MRTYTPAYNEYVFPGWEWSAGVRTFTLSSIVETGLNSTSLPATTFDYDGLHLISATNGYGGTVEFDYEDIPWYEKTASDDKSDSFGEASDEPDWGGNVSLEKTQSDPDVYKIRINGTGTYEIAVDKTLRVGGVYRLYFEFKNTSLTDASNITVKVQHGDLPSESTTLDNLHSVPAGGNYYPVYYYVASQSSETSLLLSITCNGACRLNQADRKLVTSKYRVNTRTVKDAITNPTGNVYQYTYDDPTTNYSDQDCYTTSTLYGDECTEFRGNALAREIGPAGSNGDRRATITWYSQSDEQKGNPIASMAGTNEYNESFLFTNLSSYSAYWEIPNPNNYLSMERKDGDLALKTYYSGTSWAGGIKRQNFDVSDNEAILVHFKTGGANVGALLTAEAANWYTWGIYWQQAGSTATVQARYASSTALISYQNLTTLSIDQSKWYVLLLVMDNDHLYLRVWQRDNPANFGKYELYSLPAGIASNQSWHFRQWTNNGTLWIDEYSEGKLFNLSFSEYQTTNYPVHSTFSGSVDLKLRWTSLVKETRYNFEAGGSWYATRTTQEYNASEQNGTQYGNLTRSLASTSSSQNTAWQDYRLSLTGYYPNASSVYLVGLPAFSNQYACPGTTYNGQCSSNYAAPSYPPASMVIGSHVYLYDSHTSFTAPPTAGKLTAERQLIRWGVPATYSDPRYQDTTYGYDTWGNRTTVTAYTAEGTSSLATGGARTTTSCYGTGNGTTCTADNYHTFVGWEKSIPVTDVELITQYTYDYSCAAPNSLTDPNNQTTTAGYDNLCRMNKVVKPGDSDTYPTIRIERYDNNFSQNSKPFLVEVIQRITAATNITLSQRKFYNGLGQFIQVQTPSAVVADNACSTDSDTLPDTCDLFANTGYDAYGNAVQQTEPYALSHWQSAPETSYRDWLFASDRTTVSTYDALGRVFTILAPDGTYPTRNTYSLRNTAYPDPVGVFHNTDVKDARGNTTSNLIDVWGRTFRISPPTGPTVTYTYNALDQLTQANYGGAITTLTYDFSGRKLTMDDPDMGYWAYYYDALNLIRQTDAKGQRTCLYYDNLNRVTDKFFTSAGDCPTSPPTSDVKYIYDTYDDEDSTPYGIGHRTKMEDASGSTIWTYDQRGRMLTEIKTVTGSGDFKT